MTAIAFRTGKINGKNKNFVSLKLVIVHNAYKSFVGGDGAVYLHIVSNWQSPQVSIREHITATRTYFRQRKKYRANTARHYKFDASKIYWHQQLRCLSKKVNLWKVFFFFMLLSLPVRSPTLQILICAHALRPFFFLWFCFLRSPQLWCCHFIFSEYWCDIFGHVKCVPITFYDLRRGRGKIADEFSFHIILVSKIRSQSTPRSSSHSINTLDPNFFRILLFDSLFNGLLIKTP